MAHPAISGDLWSCFYLVADMQISYVCGSKTISSASNNAISINFAKQLIRLNELEKLLSDGSLGQLFFDSATTNRPVLISLKCRKVYVGTVNMISEPNENKALTLKFLLAQSYLVTGTRTH